MHQVDLLIGWPMTRIANHTSWYGVVLSSFAFMIPNLLLKYAWEHLSLMYAGEQLCDNKSVMIQQSTPKDLNFYHPQCCERQDPNFITNITMTRWNQSNLGFHARIFQFKKVGVQYCEWTLECIINEPQSTHWWLCQTCWWSSNNISFWIISCRDRVQHQMLWTLHDIIYTHSINSCKVFLPKWGMHFCSA